MYSYLASQAAKDRQREMLAQASQRRLGQQARALARACRRAERAQRRVRGVLRLRAALGEKQLQQAYAHGKALSSDQAIDLALGESHPPT